MTEADREIVALLTDIQAAGGGGGGGSSPAGSVGDIQTKASSTTFGHITPGTGVATALAVAVGSAGGPVVLNGAGGTPSSLTLTNATGLPVAGITASTSTALGVGSINLGHASDTTITRSGSGAIQVEGVQVILSGAALGTPASGTLTNCTGLPVAGITASTSTAIGVGSIELGAASDTTITRSGAGAVQVEGVQVLLSGAALGTPASGTLTNCSGTAASLTSGITNALKSATTTVDVSAATAPSANQVLTATDSTHATWVNAATAHAVYAAASPPTTDVGPFTIALTGIAIATGGSTSAAAFFTCPSGRTFICTSAQLFVTAVTSANTGAVTFDIETSAGILMTTATASSTGTPLAGATYYSQSPVASGGPFRAAVNGTTTVNYKIGVLNNSTSCTATLFATGYYAA